MGGPPQPPRPGGPPQPPRPLYHRLERLRGQAVLPYAILSTGLNIYLLLDQRHCDCAAPAPLEEAIVDHGSPVSSGGDLVSGYWWSLQEHNHGDVFTLTSEQQGLSPESHTLSSLSPTLGADLEHETANASRRTPGRLLSGKSSSEGEQEDVLLGLIVALVFGTAVLHLTTLRTFANLQQSVVLFVIGSIVSFFMEGAKLKEWMGPFAVSYEMWMGIDPHLLLFTMLPALITGDAMTIDTNVAKRVAKQCLYLAGPGVLVNAFLAALFLQYYLGWPFLLSLTTGSILCATDPVAVVSLLKDLGASPTLTVQIQGESLLNDGTAMVLFTVAYNMFRGDSYDGFDLTEYLVKTSAMAWLMGMLIGYGFFLWISLANNKLDHKSSMIQISLTLCCAYGSFYLAEAVFHVSGVLSCVAAALTLAHNMWPHITSRDTMHHVWHTVEFVGNTVIFLLAGALVGKVMVHIHFEDYLHLIVIYLVLLVLRAGLIFLSRPLLSYLGADKEPVTLNDACVMTWGGLRGAVGLALGIQVYEDRFENAAGEPQIGDYTAQQVLFFVGGIAFLTTVINATTAPFLVAKLGMTKMMQAKQVLLMKLHAQLVHHSLGKEHKQEVANSLKLLLEHQEEILLMGSEDVASAAFHKVRATAAGTDEPPSPGALSPSSPGGDVYRPRKRLRHQFTVRDSEKAEENSEVISYFTVAKARYDELPGWRLRLLDTRPEMFLEDQWNNMLDLMRVTTIDMGMIKVVNGVFLSLVRHQYWEQLARGELQPGAVESQILLASIEMARGWQGDLVDFDYVCHKLGLPQMGHPMTPASKKFTRRFTRPSFSCKFVEKMPFNIAVALVIIFNLVFILEEKRCCEGVHLRFGIIEIFFTMAFTVELLLQLLNKRGFYFVEPWHIFESVLVLLGWVSIFLYMGALGDSASRNQIKAATTFSLLRLLRTVRLYHLFSILRMVFVYRELTVEVGGQHMERVSTLRRFIEAHLDSQEDFVRYFGTPQQDGGGRVRSVVVHPETARCLIQSQVSVFNAFHLAIDEMEKVDQELFNEINAVRESKKVTEEMEHFVHEAKDKGVLGNHEAETILRPLHDHMRKCQKVLKKTELGIQREPHHAVAGALAAPRSATPKQSWVRGFHVGDAACRAPQEARAPKRVPPKLLVTCALKNSDDDIYVEEEARAPERLAPKLLVAGALKSSSDDIYVEEVDSPRHAKSDGPTAELPGQTLP